jgi:hypothetical protein
MNSDYQVQYGNEIDREDQDWLEKLFFDPFL